MAEAAKEPWLCHNFLKDGKHRAVERYWHHWDERVAPAEDAFPQKCVLFIIPEALVWRKYLKLIRKLVSQKTTNTSYSFVLTESAVERLDHGHQSHRQAAAPQERSLLQKLVRNSDVWPLADLSIRSKDDDEWDVFRYEEMPVQERSLHALLRAPRLLPCQTCWLLVDDENNDTNRLPLESEYGDSKSVQYITIAELIDKMVLDSLLSDKEAEALHELRTLCVEEYNHRNAFFDDGHGNERDVVWTEEEIRNGLRTGKILRGRLNVTKENIKEAFVTTGSGIGRQTFFVSCGDFSHAFHQDMVLVEPLPESQWGRPIGRRRILHRQDNNNDDEGSSNTQDDISMAEAVPSARVVAIDQTARRLFVATMTDTPNSPDEAAVLVIPQDIRIPKIRIRTRSWSRFVGVRLKVEVTGWEPDSFFPTGHCVEVLGPIGELETEINALLIENQVDLDPFSTEAMACLPPEGTQWRISDKDILDRRDLRKSRRVFSVDPPGCQDIDDTMHAELLANGDIEVGVHIADVTHFVKRNSRLDHEAQARGTTFYLVDRRFDMLPSLLSSDLCSLHGGMDRLAVSVIWTFSPDLDEIKSTWEGRTIIHNCAAMTYDQADKILQGKSPDDPGKPPPPPLTAGAPVHPNLVDSLKEDLSILTRLARMRRKDREVFGGAVDLSSSESGGELKFTIVSGVPTQVAPKEDKEIHHTIAELMIMANTHVATRIHEHFPESALLRIHRSVDESRLEEIREILLAAGINFEDGDGKSLANALMEAQEKFKSRKSPFQSLLLNVATRAMTEAQYICTENRLEGEELSHYGLGLGKYTHFTSPIRRYADVVVHHQLLASISIDPSSLQWKKEVQSNPVDSLKSVPDSNVISILSGEGIKQTPASADDELDGDDLIDVLTKGASELVLGSAGGQAKSSNLVPSEMHDKDTRSPYRSLEVSNVCDGLNLHNRLAKHSSYECQALFLSLYFKNNAEQTPAVVTALRENGFFAYMPRFDLKGPVYVRDTNGDVQIDPQFMDLPRDSGLSPTLGFQSSRSCRRFPDGKCDLISDKNDERLEVKIPGSTKPFVLRPFDVVTVEVTCDDWDVRARIPSPRLQMISKGTPKQKAGAPASSSSPVNITSKSLAQSPTVTKSTNENRVPSVFGVLSAITIRPVLKEVPLRSSKKSLGSNADARDRKEIMRGRFVYGDFLNPDTRSAAQEAAQQAAAAEAAQRRVQWLEASSRRSEYDTSRKIEREITMRQQRLAAEKRNARRSKAK